MSSFRQFVYSFVLLVILLTGSRKLYGQWDLIEQLSQKQDTSDYIPYYFDGALGYNLMIAASRGYVSEIKRLIGKGADVNAATYEGATPLVLAVSSNKISAVKEILTHNPDIDKPTSAHETALLISIKNRYFDIAETLIRAGADPDYRDRHGAVGLHYASLYGYLEMTDLLLYYDAITEVKTTDGTTPLLGSVWAGNVDIADLLLQNGALADEPNNEGLTPFLLAAYFGDTLMMGLLRQYGADIYKTDNEGHNALSLAVLSGDTAALKYLLGAGKEWRTVNRSAADPYSMAAKSGRKDMISILRAYQLPGNAKREIDQVSLGLSTRFFVHDNYPGFTLTFREPYSKMGFFAGVDAKISYTRVLIKATENLFYQYRDRGGIAYAGIFRDFALTDRPLANFYFSPSLAAGYEFESRLRGSYLTTGNKLRVIPAATFKWTNVNLTVNAGIEYIRTDFYHHGPVWLRLGVMYNYYLDNVRTKIKPIRWHLR